MGKNPEVSMDTAFGELELRPESRVELEIDAGTGHTGPNNNTGL